MHCNLRLSVVAPVVLVFNCGAYNASAYKFNNSAISADLQCTHVPHFGKIRPFASTNFPVPFFRGSGAILSGLIERVECNELHQIRGDIDLSPDALEVCFIFSDFAPYRKQSASKLEIDTKFPFPCKN